MELEKYIYRIQLQLTSCKYARPISKILFLAFFGISVIYIGVFVSLCTRQGERKLEFLSNNNTVITEFQNNVLYTVKINDQEQNKPLLLMTFSFNKHLLTLKQNIATHHQIISETLLVDTKNYQSGFDLFFLRFIDIETMFLVDFTQYFLDSQNDIMIKNIQTGEFWYWEKNSLKNNQNIPFYIKMIRNFFLCQSILVGIFFICCSQSILIHQIFIFLPFYKHFKRILYMNILGQDQLFNDQEVVENWIGTYTRLLERNNKAKFYLGLALLSMFIFYSIIFQVGLRQAIQFIFGKSIPDGLNITFIEIVLINEIQGVLFLRTRSSIYFVPKYICCYYFTYIFYFEKTRLTIVFLMSEATFISFLYFYEIPALNWQRQSYYTPTEQRPRCYYMPMFQIEWINDIPQLWTIFYGLCGRKYFDRQHLTYVDRNQIQFHQILEDDEHFDNE